ncbi:hypothetical protein MTO96_038836 [Rhipicephalus appendiculatus]
MVQHGRLPLLLTGQAGCEAWMIRYWSFTEPTAATNRLTDVPELRKEKVVKSGFSLEESQHATKSRHQAVLGMDFRNFGIVSTGVLVVVTKTVAIS